MQTPRGIDSLKHLVLFAAALKLGLGKALADGKIGISDTFTLLPLFPKAVAVIPDFTTAPAELLDLDQGEAIELVEAVQAQFADVLPVGTKADAVTAAALKLVPHLVGLVRAATLDGPPVPLIVEQAPPPSE